ncbi:uncharacterized protein LOC111519224 [Drosophila willistoni]|uniref:uncharacterized protein LOC111519224 n=1 Tax=Drosophila willistoni TaxID=7260 RepID=UPI000C26CF7E|nr:uncharacterized protein LOC111519224 [Drosophila willistoni]
MPLDNNKRPAKKDDLTDSGENAEDSNNNNQDNDNDEVVENGPTTSKRARVAEPKDYKRLPALLIRRRQRNNNTNGDQIAFKSQFYPGPITFGGNAANCIPSFPQRATNPELQPLGGGQLKKTHMLPSESEASPKSEENQSSEVNLTGLSSTAKKIYNMIKDQGSDKQKLTCSTQTDDSFSFIIAATKFRQNAEHWNKIFNDLHFTRTVLTPTKRVPRTFLFDPPLPLPPARERQRRIFTFVSPIGLEEDFMNYMNDRAGITKGLDPLFSGTSTVWECETCLMTNTESRQQCVVCDAAKPVSGANPSAETPFPLPEVKLPLSLKKLSSEVLDKKSSSTDYFPSPVASYDFSEALKAKTITKKWTCCVCHAENNMTRLACIFCETLKPQSSDSSSDD